MKAFTYRDYIECIHTLRLNAVFKLAEEESTYKIEANEKEEKYIQMIKRILENKEEMAKFLNNFLNPKIKIKSENLIKYINDNIAKKYNTREIDIIYKLNNQEIYYLVEFQTKIDSSTPYRVLNYCIDIMQEWSKEKKQREEGETPIIVPIIIYTGEEKWKISKEKRQISDYVFENYKIDLNYNVIEINRISNKILAENKSLFTMGVLLGRAKNKEELKQNLNILTKNIKEKNDIKEG